MDQTLFNREYRTQQWTTTFDSPLKSEGPQNSLSRLVGGFSILRDCLDFH